MLYVVTFTLNIPQMLAYIPYMDRMGKFFTVLPLKKCCVVSPFQARDESGHRDWRRGVLLSRRALSIDGHTVGMVAKSTS